MSDVLAIVREVRELINEPRKQHYLLQRSAHWNMLCASLDVIEDTQCCIEALPETTPAGSGLRYLYIYGVLQAMYAQQDALSNIAKALELPYATDPVLKKVREVRNDTIGHPSSRYGKAFVFLVQSSVTLQGFELMTTFADGRPPAFRSVDIRKSLESQCRCVVDTLSAFVQQLREEEREHREEFRNVSLADIFPATLAYHFEKVHECIRRPDIHEVGAANVRLILDTVAAFRTALEKRGVLGAYEGVAHELEDIEWPLEELQRFFSGDPSSTLNERSARIFAFYCSHMAKALKKSAEELDGIYKENP